MTTKNLPNVGDIITSLKFAFGYFNDESKKFINVDGKTKKRYSRNPISEDERVAIAAKTSQIPPKTKTIDLGAYDPARASAKFAVETAGMKSDGIGHDQGGSYILPDSWHVWARRLNEDGSYNPKGEVICFYMSVCPTCIVGPKDVQIVGKMKM